MSKVISAFLYGLLCTLLIVQRSQARLPGAEHHDDSCAIMRIHAGGLASNINQVLLSMTLLPYSKLFIDEAEFLYKCSADGSWDDIFQGSIRAKGQESTERNCTAISVFDGVYKMKHLFPNKDSPGLAALFEEKVTALQQLWPLSEQLKRVSAHHTDFVKSLPGPVTAVHVRSGDKSKEDEGEQRKPYFPHDFAEAALSYPGARGGTCLVYGDDILANHATAQELLRSVSCYPIIMGGSIRGHHQDEFGKKEMSERCVHLHRILPELSGMAAADYFIGSMSSNVPRLVALMRVALNGLDRSTARDVFDMEWVAYRKT